MTSIICPHCSRSGSLKAAVPAGTTVRCPGCKQMFAIPQVSPEATNPPSESDPVETILGPATTGPTDIGIDLSDYQPTHHNPSPRSQSMGRSANHSPPSHNRPWLVGSGSTIASVAVGLMALVFLAIFAFKFIDSGRSRYDERSSSNRFANDNAYGAAANALENIASRPDHVKPESWLIAGLLCVLIGSLEKLRHVIIWDRMFRDN